MKDRKLRKTGINVMDDARWGTHFCLFYQTRDDLVDILVPYFKVGLENNEFCMWVTSEPLEVEDAKSSLRAALPGLDDYMEKGQIEILDYRQWYTKSGVFEGDMVLQGWVEKEDQAVKRGFDGLRLTGNTFWLEQRDWRAFTDYEAVVDSVIGQYRMLAICTYPLDKCGAAEVVDVVSSHEVALIKRVDEWELIESAQHKRAEQALRESEIKHRNLFEHTRDAIFLADAQTGILIDANLAACNMLGLPRKKIVGMHQSQLHPPEEAERYKTIFQNHVEKGRAITEELYVQRADGQRVPVDISASVVELAGKPIIQGCFRDITERKQVEEELRKSRQQLRNLSAHLLSVREQERTHIARELHDELGQALSILQIDLTWLENRLRTETDKKLWPEKVKSMSKLVETTIKEVQRISRELRPGVLDNLGLAAAVEWQAKEFHKRTGIRCKLCLGVEDMEIGKDLSTALFRILQEALTNVARHSKASSVKINLVEKANKLILRIQDNGRGITTKQISDPGSMGLIGMRERVNFMNGELMLQGVPNKGTTLTVSVPMAKKTFERLQTSQRLNVEG